MRDAPELIASLQRALGKSSPSFFPISQVFGESEEPFVIPTTIVLTDVLPGREAKALLLELERNFQEKGVTALLLSEGFPPSDYFVSGGAGYAIEPEMEAYRARASEDPFARFGDLIDRHEARLLETCERLNGVVPGDLDDCLDRIDPEALQAFEDGEEDVDLTPDEELPRDLKERFARGLERRAQFVAEAQRGFPGLMVGIDPLRAHDLESALHEMPSSACRLTVACCEPHLTPLYLGFGGAPSDHSTIWRSWGARFGARPIYLEEATLYAYVAEPPLSLREHVRYFAEQLAYNPDTRADGALALLGATFHNKLQHFWWD